ncbi:hypothetical protein K9M59_04005 [Candidatus Gracilibacteria bacterium]|nr:hypothetical protein [Candidatus Gracilibacteria bacterium]MCF7819487.1 hypothetical protein [Candidatus Gracilibacteria bacterium]
MSRKWIYLRLGHIVIDLLGVYGAFCFAYFVRVGWVFSTDFPFQPFAWVSAFSTILWIGFLLLSKYYRIPPRSEERVGYDALLIGLGGAIGIGFMIVTYFFRSELFFSRLLNIYALLFGTIFLLISQFVFRLILSARKKKHKDVYRALIVGANRVAEKLIHAIKHDAYAPYIVIGVIDPYGLAKEIKDSRVIGKLDQLEPVCEKENITAIIQCDAFEHTMNLISFCEEKDIKFQFDPALRGIYEENLRIREVAGQTMISFVQRNYQGIKKWKYRFIDWVLRQVFDVD